MLVFEPILLRIFATTAGKAILGICILDCVPNKRGGKVTILQGFARTLSVICYGYGLFIPVFTARGLVESHKMCRDEYTTHWDKQECTVCYVKESKIPLRIFGYILAFIFMIAVMVCITVAVIMPQQLQYIRIIM